MEERTDVVVGAFAGTAGHPTGMPAKKGRKAKGGDSPPWNPWGQLAQAATKSSHTNLLGIQMPSLDEEGVRPRRRTRQCMLCRNCTSTTWWDVENVDIAYTITSAPVDKPIMCNACHGQQIESLQRVNRQARAPASSSAAHGRSSGSVAGAKRKQAASEEEGEHQDGEDAEEDDGFVSRKRGRPKGSKNKPKAEKQAAAKANAPAKRKRSRSTASSSSSSSSSGSSQTEVNVNDDDVDVNNWMRSD